MTNAPNLMQVVVRLARDAGFDLAGVAAIRDGAFAELDHFTEWIESGHAGEMDYLKARNDQGELKRAALRNAAPWAKSVIVCALNYNTPQPYSTESDDATKGWISRYSWFKPAGAEKAVDYHDSVLSRLRQVEGNLLAWAHKDPGAEIQTRCYVDTGPIVERVVAKYAGIGWIAKNTCVINQELGSWMFLGVILTSIEVDKPTAAPGPPAEDRCGSCTRCIQACPTGALIAPYKMDATRCIAYLTIEKRGMIPEELRSGIGRNVFGCDICQDVCPWNGAQSVSRQVPVTTAAEFQARPELINPPLEWLAGMSRDEFNVFFRASPIKRAKYEGFRRNVAISMGNSGDARFLPLLERMANDPDQNLAEHAQWAMRKLESVVPAK